MNVLTFINLVTEQEAIAGLARAKECWERLKPQPGRQAAAKARALELIAEYRFVPYPEPSALDARHMELKCEQASFYHIASADEVARVRAMDDDALHEWRAAGGHRNYPVYRG
jgi:hypothetical protein